MSRQTAVATAEEAGFDLYTGKSRKTWFIIPEGLYLAVKVEAARSGLPMKALVSEALSGFLKTREVFAKAVEKVVREHPEIIKAKGMYFAPGGIFHAPKKNGAKAVSVRPNNKKR